MDVMALGNPRRGLRFRKKVMSISSEHKSKIVLLIDWDGCIHKTLHVWLEATQTILTEYGISLPDQFVTAQIVPHLQNALELNLISAEQIEEFILQVVNLAQQKLANASIDHELWDMLQLLHDNGIRLAVVSNSSFDFILAALQKNNLPSNIFGSIVTPEKSKLKLKPDPSMLLYALTTLGCDVENAYMLDDSETGIKAANQVGIESIHWNPADNQQLNPSGLPANARPNFTVTTPLELHDLFFA